jgi:hypothetical protein
MVIPAINRLPLPPQRLQKIALWPRRLGHKNLFGIGFGQSNRLRLYNRQLSQKYRQSAAG